MKIELVRRWTLTAGFVVGMTSGVGAYGQQWTAPTPAELSMTSMPEVPGAPAVVLYREQTTDDGLHMYSYYMRVKVLTEGGKDYANISLPFITGNGAGVNIDSIAGRTIHADGTIMPFTGKPYEKLIVKAGGFQEKARVFTLPAVEVGSILEYRYKMRFDDNYFFSPNWDIQSDLYLKKAHFMWRPTSREILAADGKVVAGTVAWTPILPPGVQVKQTPLRAPNDLQSGAPQVQLDLDVADIPPLPHESMMPPLDSLSYRVLFYYTGVRTAGEFWKGEGKRWSKARDKFIGPNSAVEGAAKGFVAAGDTQETQLKKVYASVESLENTDFTRARTTNEDKAQGLKEVNSTDDIWARKRGSGDELTELFVAMARALGMKAYVMGVVNRSDRLFLPTYLNIAQIDDFVAVVNVDGKERYFDPGQKYCTFGQLAWKHTLSGGIRQTDGSAELSSTPGARYQESHESRVADLTLDEQGVADGTVTLSYTGAPALRWRQEAVRGDDTSLNADLKRELEGMVPGGMDVRVTQVDNLTDPDKPLVVKYAVKGVVGAATGKRLLLPTSLFTVNRKPMFNEAKRDLPVDMHYANQVQDAVRYKYPAGLVIESAPTKGEGTLANAAVFSVNSDAKPGAVTLYRNVTIGRVLFPAADYADLRTFYGKLEAKDQESLVLTRASAAGGSGGGLR